MITIEFDKNALNGFKKDLDKIKKIISDNDLNMFRANKFRDYTIDTVKRGNLNIRNISWATKLISGSDHAPENLTGKLLEEIKVKESSRGKGAEMGYFSDSKLVPGKSITYSKLAELQHTGYRIPLQGEKGEKVRRWLAYHFNIRMKKEKQWLIVPARPFLPRSVRSYEMEGGDLKASVEYINKKLAKNVY